MTDVRYEHANLRIGGVDLEIAAASRGGDLDPVVFLHGFGSTKEDYLDIACQRAFTGHAFLAYDAPGCGATWCGDLAGISIPFLARTAQAMLDRAGIRRFHLVGHSMGGLTAPLLAHTEPGRVLSFTDIEGNLAPEDCFLSRQILAHPADDEDGFIGDLAERVRRSRSSSSALFAASLPHKVRPGAVRAICESMVDLSDHGDLMTKFLALTCPRMFMYGEENAALSYLAKLDAGSVELAEVPRSGHWPMYANPVAMWDRLAAFIQSQELLQARPRHLCRAGSLAKAAYSRARSAGRLKRRIAAAAAAIIAALAGSPIAGAPEASASTASASTGETVIVTATGLVSAVAAVLSVGGTILTQYHLIDGVEAVIPAAVEPVLAASLASS